MRSVADYSDRALEGGEKPVRQGQKHQRQDDADIALGASGVEMAPLDTQPRPQLSAASGGGDTGGRDDRGRERFGDRGGARGRKQAEQKLVVFSGGVGRGIGAPPPPAWRH